LRRGGTFLTEVGSAGRENYSSPDPRRTAVPHTILRRRQRRRRFLFARFRDGRQQQQQQVLLLQIFIGFFLLRNIICTSYIII